MAFPVILLYLLAGVAFSIWFLIKGAGKSDESAAGVSWLTKLLWFPGVVALWPVLWFRSVVPANAAGPNPAPHRHRLIWSALAVALPVLFCLAILVLPGSPLADPVGSPSVAALPSILQSFEGTQVLANLRGNIKGERQLEIVIKSPLEVPAATLTLNGKPLGILSTRGVYRFNIRDSIIDDIRLVDPVHQAEILRLPLH